jgi:CRISPR type I-E-associated protein CasB/Cse2
MSAPHAEQFVQAITKICRSDPGRRAALRRGLRRRPEQAPTMHATVARWLPDSPRPAQERAFYAIAAMLAAQPPSARGQISDDEEPTPATPRRVSLGESLAGAVRRPGRALAEGSAEKRLHLLTRQSLDGLHQQLPGVVRHLRQLDIPVDWVALMNDLATWPRDRDRIAKRWLQDFYSTLHKTAPEE